MVVFRNRQDAEAYRHVIKKVADDLDSDIDETSVKHARENVERNGYIDRISIKYNDNPDRIFVLEKDQRWVIWAERFSIYGLFANTRLKSK